MGRRRRRVAWVGVILLLLAALLVAALPWLARPLVAGALSAALGRPVAIAALHWHAAELSIVADDVRVGTPPDQVTVARITVAVDPRASNRRHLVLDRVAVEAPRGTVALDQLLPSAARDGGTRAGPLRPPLAVTVREIVVSDAALAVRAPAPAAAVALVVTSARATGVELGGAAELQLSGDLAGTLDGAPLTASADVQMAGEERRLVGEAAVKRLALRAGVLPLPPPVAALTGTLDATATVAIGEPPGREAIALDLRLVDARAGADLRAAAVAMPAARIDLAARRVDLGAVRVQQPVWSLDLEAAPAAAPPPPMPASPTAAAPRWTLHSGMVSVRGGELRLRRGAAATGLRLERGRWDGLADDPTPLSLTATAAGGGAVSVAGTLGIGPLVAEGEVRVDGLDLAPWSPLADLPLRLGRGAVTGRASVVYRDGLRGIAGDLRASDVHTLPPDPARPAEVLAVAGAAATFAYAAGDPPTIAVSSASLSYPYAMVVRRAAGTFPLSLLGGGGDGGGGRAALRLGQLTVVGGKVELVDETLVPPFWTSLTGIAASATDGALPPGTVARFALAGRRDEISPVSVSGTVTAAGLDARVEVADVLLDSLNPYVAPLLGYRITAGRLSTVATATTKPPLLVSVADVVLDGVDVRQIGTDAILAQSGVPLPIALGLIADAGGRIDLNLPFSIDTTSGEVAVGSVVWQAVRKAIAAALTSPLRILGSLFGGGGAPHAFAVDPIPFATGSAALDAAGRDRVGAIARIVEAHPGLLLVLLPQLTAADLAAAGAAGAGALARERNAAARDAFVAGGVPAVRVLLAPWDPAAAARATERPGVYVELQDAG